MLPIIVANEKGEKSVLETERIHAYRTSLPPEPSLREEPLAACHQGSNHSGGRHSETLTSLPAH